MSTKKKTSLYGLFDSMWFRLGWFFLMVACTILVFIFVEKGPNVLGLFFLFFGIMGALWDDGPASYM